MLQKILQGLFIVLIYGSLSYITVQTFLEPTTYTTENHAMAPRPAWPQQIKELESFIQGIEAWWSDAIHFRQVFIKTFNQGRAILGISPQREVIIGKEGWLFFSGEGSVDDYRNAKLLTPEEITHWKNYLLFRHYDAEKRGAVYLFLSIPNKERIYGEYLPDNFSQLSSTTRFDQIIEAMRDTPVHILDLRPALFAAKKEVQIYTKTDTHWNYLGANVAQYEILKSLQTFYPDLPARLLLTSDYRYGTSGDFFNAGLSYGGGGLNKSLGFLDQYLEEVEPLFRATPGIDCIQPGTFTLPDMYHWIQGAHRAQLFQADTCKTGKYRALVFRDSFASLLKPQLSSTFSSVFYLWMGRPYALSQWEYFMDNQKPDIVIDASVERYLNLVPRQGESYPADFDPNSY